MFSILKSSYFTDNNQTSLNEASQPKELNSISFGHSGLLYRVCDDDDVGDNYTTPMLQTQTLE